MKYINVIVNNLWLHDGEENIMGVELLFEEQVLDKNNRIISEKALREMTLDLDIKYMGIDWDGEFEYELAKDFQRAVDKYLENNNDKLPSEMELKKLVELNYYDMIENNEEYLKSKGDIFDTTKENEMKGDN